MQTSILVPLNDSVSSKGILEFLLNRCPFCSESCHLTFLHVFRKPTSGEELMGKKFMAEQPDRFRMLLENASRRMIDEGGISPDNIAIKLLTDPYPSVTEGIIDFCNQGQFDMVIIGRKQMTKSEEFVRGDISIKLIRALDKTSVLVVKSG